VNRDKGYGAAVMANSDRGIELGEEIVRGIAREYGWAGILPEPVAIAKLSTAELGALAGGYRLNEIEGFRLAVEDGRIVGKPSFGDPYELLPISSDLFIRKDRDSRYQIERSDGRVVGVTVVSGDERTPARRLKPGERLPAELLADGEVNSARAACRKVLLEHPDDPGIAERRLNQIGYWLAGHGDYGRAIAVLKLNTELRPTSSNAYDSLAEISLQSGDRAGALAAYRKVLEVLPADTKAEPDLKRQLRNVAEAKIKELGAK
jgi:tetratricopeptide (TPR) repeat protein